MNETEKTCKMLNNRKLAMARLKVGSKVNYKGEPAKIKKLSDRGFPVIDYKGEEKKVFVEEIVNLDELIEKYGKAA